MFNRQTMKPDATSEWRWDGSERVARSMFDHARDDAGLLYFQPPNWFGRHGLVPGEPVAAAPDRRRYQAARVRVRLEGDQGEEWRALEFGDLVRKSGPAEDPTFEIVSTRDQARALGG